MPVRDNLIPLLVAVLIFLACFFLFVALLAFFHFRAKQRRLVEKVQSAAERVEVKTEEGFFLLRAYRGFVVSLGDLITRMGEKLKAGDTEEVSHVRSRLLKAGLRKYNHVYLFWGVKYLLAIIPPLWFIALNGLEQFLLNRYAVLAVAFYLAVVGFYLPNLWLSLRIRRRRTQMMRGLPDALDLMVVCVGAGMGLDGAINRVAEDMKLSNPVVAEELYLLVLETRAGKDRREALKNLARRNDLEDLTSLVSILLQTEQFGTSVSDALTVYADTVRTKRYQRAEEIAAQLTVKLVLPLITLIFPGLFVVLVGPAAIQAYRVLIFKH